MAETQSQFDTENPDNIRRNIERTRASLSEKLETLEHEVKGTVEDAKDTVKHTVEDVKKAVDVRYHIGKNPWMFFAVSFATGLLVGASQRGSSNSTPQASDARNFSDQLASSARQDGTNASIKQTTSKAGLLDSFEDEFNILKGTAIGIVANNVRDLLLGSAPVSLANTLNQVLDSVTRKLGGTPQPAKFKGMQDQSVKGGW